MGNIFSPLGSSSNPLNAIQNNQYDDGDELSFTQPAPQLGSKLITNLCNDSFIDERQHSFEDNDENMNFSFTNDNPQQQQQPNVEAHNNKLFTQILTQDELFSAQPQPRQEDVLKKLGVVKI